MIQILLNSCTCTLSSRTLYCISCYGIVLYSPRLPIHYSFLCTGIRVVISSFYRLLVGPPSIIHLASLVFPSYISKVGALLFSDQSFVWSCSPSVAIAECLRDILTNMVLWHFLPEISLTFSLVPLQKTPTGLPYRIDDTVHQCFSGFLAPNIIRLRQVFD